MSKTYRRSFEDYFNGLAHDSKVRLANRRIQALDLDLKFEEVFEVKGTDEWALTTRDKWVEVRDRLVWDDEEVVL